MPLQIHQRRHGADTLRSSCGPPSIAGVIPAAHNGRAGLWQEAQDIRPEADRPVSKNMRSPSRAMAESGAAGGRTSRTG